jgi:heme ABC exporter ATP-binding subunit CcmA
MEAKAMAQVVRFRAAVALAGRFPALAGVDLSLDSGEVVLVVGANGAGKTSLLRACAGLLPVTAGEATVLGIDLTVDHTTVRRHVGLLGHAAPLYDELSAAENVRFAVRALRLPAAAGDRALERLGMVGRLRSTPTGRLSAGQRRRVALAALLARRPALWLLDEPHAGLDTPTRTLLGELIGEAAADGAAVLLSSHEPELAIPLSDRVVVMSGGRITATSDGGRHLPLDAPPTAEIKTVPTAEIKTVPTAEIKTVPAAEIKTVPAVELPPEQGSMGAWHVA